MDMVPQGILKCDTNIAPARLRVEHPLQAASRGKSVLPLSAHANAQCNVGPGLVNDVKQPCENRSMCPALSRLATQACDSH